MREQLNTQLNIILSNPAFGPLRHELNSEAIDTIISEGGENFYKYIEGRGLADKQELIVLSSQHHYYYDPEEMVSLTTLVNLIELNKVKDIKNFLHSCLYYLPPNSNFVGCFTDNEKVNGYELKYRSSSDSTKGLDDIEYGIVSKFPFLNMLYSLMDSKIYRYMSKAEIIKLLGEYGFKVINMTDVSGLTMFHSQKMNVTYN
jgi:hypothetical protein